MDGEKGRKSFLFCRPCLSAAAALVLLIWSSESTVTSRVPNFQTSDRCVACHNGLSTPSGEDVSVGLAWQPTMMANSARDPYWQASVRRETLDHPESAAAVEDECSVCHMPMARFESKQMNRPGTVFSHLGFLPDNSADQLAADGVSCSLCHRIGKEKLGTRESFVGNFMIAAPSEQVYRQAFGPYTPDAGRARIMTSSTGGFVPTESRHIRASEVCATCHTLLTRAIGPAGKVSSEFPEQVPYLEWLHSAHRGQRSCQSCHMPAVQDKVAIASVQGALRTAVARHAFLGGNFFVNGILNANRNELSVRAGPNEFAVSANRIKDHLRSESARVSIGSLVRRDRTLQAEVVIENLAGHKLPTAYPSRRVWLHVVVRDKNGRSVFESGALGTSGAIAGNDNDVDATKFEPHYTEIRSPEQVQIYEAVMADNGGAVTTGLLQAVGYLKDNRLLPRGFDKKTADAEVAVAGDALEDGDFIGGSDRIRYLIDTGAAQGPFQIEAELCYQPIGYRWAMNLKTYNAEETRRFVRYYEAASGSSAIVLARARAEQ